MAVLTLKSEYQLSQRNFIHSLQFTRGVKIVLFLLLLPLLVYYSLLVSASVAVIYAVHANFIENEKVISLMLFVLWSLAGLITSLTGLVSIFKFKWPTVITGLVSLSTALVLEYALTIYECAKLKASAFAHIIIIFQFMLILAFTSIAIRLRTKSRRDAKALATVGQEFGL